MSILSLIEAKIGSLHNWPQDILRHLFYIRRPTYFMIAEIVAFLFVNKISREDALDFFTCSAIFHRNVKNSLMKNMICGAGVREQFIWPLITI